MTSCGHLWRASLLGINIALLLFFHWTRNAREPLMSVAPMILSGSRPLSNGDILSLLSPFLSLASLSFSSSECFVSFTISLTRRGGSSFFDSSFLDFSFSFSFSFSLVFSFVEVFSLSFSSESALRFLPLSFTESSFLELTVDPSFELALRRLFFFSELFLDFFGYNLIGESKYKWVRKMNENDFQFSPLLLLSFFVGIQNL